MTAPSADQTRPASAPEAVRATVTLAASTLVFFVITLDAVIVNVALPSIRDELGGGIGDLQWIVDGYTLMFAALLLSCGSLADRLGPKRLLLLGMVLFMAASSVCGLAPSMPVLIAARFVQGAAAATMMPASMALLNHAYTAPARRNRAVAIWAIGGSLASTSGPVLGGLLTLASWRLIFFVNIPVGLIALYLIARSIPVAHHRAPIDWAGQITAVLAMAGLTFGVIDAGESGFAAPQAIFALAIALVAAAAFVVIQRRVAHPMVPPDLFRDRNAGISVLIGFAFMVGFYGLPFVMSLGLQQHRGLTALETGFVFLPMMLIGLALTPLTPRIGERVGRKALIITGLAAMAAALLLLAMLPAAPLWLVSSLMTLAGIAGPFVSPPTTAILLDSVPARRGGIASGVFNTSRQIGGAVAVAVFGLLLNSLPSRAGEAASLLAAAAVCLLTAGAALWLDLRQRPEPLPR
ncbi:MFS transporter [Sinomonas gamaensis]|uniref:MFS transporter n=1 Tax=Sinomonas gamaensis TaxID=2565624 RepID=UPI001108FAD1|nr:MFS transporter [Sinomonas gamaensis]